MAICEEGNSVGVWHLATWLGDLTCLKSCLFLNIEALYINSPVPPCDCRRKCTETTPIFAYVSFYKNILKKGRVQCIFANFIA